LVGQARAVDDQRLDDKNGRNQNLIATIL